ncbi:hypothetical protein E2C01_015731 [Portunus trituberculatus]|uniref:Uncharacterized protein n=1 Tax=Portunus trituberculatus TaxID=210409 RepID=A0A5B7DMB3_PORTR|nr:hypothetical protein [Portunus trituberculatus]
MCAQSYSLKSFLKTKRVPGLKFLAVYATVDLKLSSNNVQSYLAHSALMPFRLVRWWQSASSSLMINFGPTLNSSESYASVHGTFLI